MLTTRSRKNGNSIVVTLPIFNGVKQEPDKEYIVVYGEDHRRFRFYERALTRYGYEKKLTDDGWAMVKKVLRNNYDTEVS